MSRARAKADRVPLDVYQTPQLAADAICERLYRTAAPPAVIMEPSAGTGAFVRAARARWPHALITAVDINGGYRAALTGAGANDVLIEDWVKYARWAANIQLDYGPTRLIVGNPPYTQAQEHVEAGLEWLRDGDRLAFLLRINFLGAVDRVSFWRRPGLEWIAALAPRPSFTGGGSDGTGYALFCWRKGFRGVPRIARPIVGPKAWGISAARPRQAEESVESAGGCAAGEG